MYSVQNNNVTAQAVKEEVKVNKEEMFELTFGNGRVVYHFYSDGSITKSVKVPFEGITTHDLNIEELDPNGLMMQYRAKAMGIINK